VRPGDTITGEVEVTKARADKPITELKTRVVRDDGTLVLDGDAVRYTMPVAKCVTSEILTKCNNVMAVPYDRDALAARCANTIATPPRVATEAISRRSVTASEISATPPNAAITGTDN
jgi:hypothetical protein